MLREPDFDFHCRDPPGILRFLAEKMCIDRNPFRFVRSFGRSVCRFFSFSLHFSQISQTSMSGWLRLLCAVLFCLSNKSPFCCLNGCGDKRLHVSWLWTACVRCAFQCISPKFTTRLISTFFFSPSVLYWGNRGAPTTPGYNYNKLCIIDGEIISKFLRRHLLCFSSSRVSPLGGMSHRQNDSRISFNSNLWCYSYFAKLKRIHETKQNAWRMFVSKWHA